MDIKQEKASPYIVTQFLRTRKSGFHRQCNNHSLPSINTTFKDEKVNLIRNQIDDTKNEIAILKARINALKGEKIKHEKKKEKHYSEIDFIKTVRDRLHNDKKQKQDFQLRKEKQLEYLKMQALSMREKMIKDREVSKYLVNEQKEANGEQERQRRRDDEENIRRFKSIEIAENQIKAKIVKKTELQIEQKMKEFNKSRIIFAKQNHTKRVEKSLSEKEKLEKVLKKLRSQESAMIQECKRSQADMLSSLYQLESLNPERKRINSINSISSKTTTFKQI